MVRALIALLFGKKRTSESYGLDGAGVEPLDTEHFARDPQYPIERLDQKFRSTQFGDPTL